MERIKKKLLTIILIVIAGIVGYQAYVMAAETYGRWAGARVPFYSNGVRIYCREHHNGWAYGSGADIGNTYQCTGEYRTLDHGANGFAYYVSRVGFVPAGGYGDRVQTLIWNNSGASQGSTILNMNSNFVGWFEGYNGLNFENIGASNEGFSNGDAGYTPMIENNAQTLADYIKDYTTKVAELFPDTFFEKTYINGGENYVPEESSQTQNTNDFIENEFNTSKEELKKIEEQYFQSIKINDKNTNKKAYDYNTFRNIIDNKQIDWKNITTAEKEQLIEDCLNEFGVYWIPEEEDEKSQIGTKIMQEVRELLSSPNIKETLKNEYKVDEKEIDEIANKIEFIKEELKVKNFLKSDEGLKETTSGEYTWNVYEENIEVPEAERDQYSNKDKISEMESFASLALKCSAMNGSAYDVPSIKTDNGNIIPGASATDATSMLQVPNETDYKDGMDDSRLWYYMYYLLDKTKIVDKYDSKTIEEMKSKFTGKDQEGIREKRVFEYAEATAYAIAEQGAVTQIIEDYIATKITDQMTISDNIEDTEIEEIDLFLKHNTNFGSNEENKNIENAKAHLKEHRNFTNLNDDEWDAVVEDIETILKNTAFQSELKDELSNKLPYDNKTIHEEAENIAYEIQQQQYDGARADNDIITEISFEEYKYLYELFKLYQHFYNMNNNGKLSDIQIYASEKTATANVSLANLRNHLNTYWDDGIGSLYRVKDENGNWVNRTELVATHKFGKVKATVTKNVYGEDVIIYTNTNINRSTQEGQEGKNDEGGATLWKYVEEGDIQKDGTITPKTITKKDSSGKETTYYTGSAFYYEDDQNATVALFDNLLCMQDSTATCVHEEASLAENTKLRKYAKFFCDSITKKDNSIRDLCDEIDDRYKDLADIVENPFEKYSDGTYKHPEIVELLKEVKFGGTAGDKAGKEITENDYNSVGLYDKLQVIFTAYEKKVKSIAAERTTSEALWGNGSFNLVNLGEGESLDIRFSTTTWEAARVYQWLKKVPNPTTEPGVTNMDKIAGQVKVDDENARVYIDQEKGKYLIGPYTLNYATITLNNEQILGVQGFDLKLDILKEDGTIETKTLTRGNNADNYKIVAPDNSTKKIKANGKIVSIPKSGKPFYIELDKDVKGKDQYLTENDLFSFSLNYKYLDKIEAVVHFLRDCTARGNDAANPTSPDWQWSSSHPQRLVAITFSQSWNSEYFSTETKTREYDFKLRKVNKETNEGVNGGKFVAAAKYKNVKTGEEKYFDLVNRIKKYDSFDAVKNENDITNTYLSEYQPEGDGYVLWENIPESIAEGKTDEKGIYWLSEEDAWTLEGVEVTETEAPDGFRIPTKEELELPQGYSSKDYTGYYTVTIPKSGNVEMTWKEPEVPMEYIIPVMKENKAKTIINGLDLQYWFVDLTVPGAKWSSEKWTYGPNNPQNATTGAGVVFSGKEFKKDGVAYLKNDMYGDAIMLVIVEKPKTGYSYQYFKKIEMVYSAKKSENGTGADIKFLDYADIKNEIAKQNLSDYCLTDEEKAKIKGTDLKDGVLLVKDKDDNMSSDISKKVTGKDGTVTLNAKSTIAQVGNELVTIINDEMHPYSLEIIKVDENGKNASYTGEDGKTHYYLDGTQFEYWITPEGTTEPTMHDKIEVKNGKATLSNIVVYGDNIKLALKEIPNPGFTTNLTERTDVLVYDAKDNGEKATLTKKENTYPTNVLVPSDIELPEGLDEPVTIENGDNICIKLVVENESAPYYLKFLKTDENGKPLGGATFTLANMNPMEKEFNDSHIIGTATSKTLEADNPENGYLEFKIDKDKVKSSEKVTLFLYEESSIDGHMYSNTNKLNPVKIEYKYDAGSENLEELHITYNGKDLTENWSKLTNKEFTSKTNTLHCLTKDVQIDQQTTKKENDLRDNCFVFDFGKLNEIFTLTNYAVSYNLQWDKVEDTTDLPLGDAEFEVSIVKGDNVTDDNLKSIVESIINNTTLPAGVSFAQYEKKPAQNSTPAETADVKNLGKLNGEKQEGQDIKSSSEDADKGKVSVNNIVTYGKNYAIIKEVVASPQHQLLKDIIIAPYSISKGETQPTWANDIYVYKPAEDGKTEATLTKYSRENGSVSYKNKGVRYENASLDGNTLEIINYKEPYSLEINKINALTGKGIEGVQFEAKIYHKEENDTAKKLENLKTQADGKIKIDDIYEYSEDDNDSIILELYEKVPEGHEYYDKYGISEIVYVAEYVKKEPTGKLVQKTGYILGYLKTNKDQKPGDDNEIQPFEKIGDTSKIQFTISEGGDDSKVHEVKVPNMPTYSLQAIKKEKFDGALKNVDVNSIKFTGRVRKGGVDSSGDVIQYGQPYSDNETLDLTKFSVELSKQTLSTGEDAIIVSADGINTSAEFDDGNGNVSDEVKTFTLVLEELANEKYAIKNSIEIEYTCKADKTNGTWITEYKKVKYGDKTQDISLQGVDGYVALIDTDEIEICKDKDGHLIIINKYDEEPVQISLQKKDEDGNLLDGITFKGTIEELDQTYKDENGQEIKIANETNETVSFEETTGEKTGADGEKLQGTAVIENVNLTGNVKLTITEESWKDPTNKPPLEFPEGPIEITGIYIKEELNGNTVSRRITVPTGKLTVKVGSQEAKEIDINSTEALNELVSFSTDANVSTFYITNKYKRYNLADNDEDKDDTHPPFPDKVIRDVQGNDTEYKNEDKKIQFKGTITDSNGEVLQEDVKVTFEKKETQNGGSKVSIDAIGIKGSISGKDENGQNKEFKLVLNENTGDEPITVIYTCTYDSEHELFTAKIIGYEYKGIRYNKNEKPLESPIKADTDTVPGRVDNDGSLINYNKLYIPITKRDEKGNLVNGVVFKGTIEYPKDENGKTTKYGENGQSSWDFETVTGGQYYNFEKAKMETAPDGVAVIVIPYEMDGDFIVTITDEYWGTKEGDIWTTTKGTMPDEQPYDLEFMKFDAAIPGYSVKKEKVDEWKTVSKLYYNGNKVEYTVENMEDEAVNVTAYNYIDVDKDGHIKFVNDEIRYNLDENTKPLFDEKIKVDSLGNAFQVKDNISFTGYIKDTDGKTLQEGQSINEEIRDKDKFTVGLDSEGRIIATDILGEISGDENTEFYFVLQELGEGEGQPLEITVIYTSVYNKQTRTFDITIKGYEYNGERYDITTETGDNTFNEIVKGYVWHKQENGEEKRDLINVLETSIPLIKYEEAKKSEGGQPILRNGIQFTGKVEAVEERVGSNGIKEYTTKKNAEGNEISQYFKIVTGEKQKDINGQNCKDPKTGLEYPSYDGVATIYGITKDYVGKVRITITEEKWKDGKELSPKENEVNFVDDIIEIIVDVKEQTEQDGTKKLVVDYGENLNWNTYSKNSTTENSSLSEELNEKIEEVIKAKGQSTTENYKVKENDEFASALLDIDTYNNDKKQDDVIGIKVVNEVKTYDIEIPKVVEVEKDGKKTYRALTPEEAAELRFTAKIYDSTYNENSQDAKPLQELDENHVRVVVLDKDGNEIKPGENKENNNNNETKSVVRVSGIRGSIVGEKLTLVLHEEESGGIKKIDKDIQVTYKYTNNEANTNGKPELLTFKDPNVTGGNGNGIIDVKQIENKNGEEQYKQTDDSKNPNLVVTDDGVAIVQTPKDATLVIKKVKKVKDANGIEVEEPVSGIKFTIRVCGDCDKDCDKDPEKCTCGEDCKKCTTLTATSNGDGIAEFKDITTTGDVKVVILKEEWDTDNGASTDAEKEGNDKIEFIKEPVVISGIKIETGKEGENNNTVNYKNAKVEDSKEENGDKASSHVSIDSDFGMQIVFKNDTATYDLEAFDSKVTNYNGTIEKVLKDVTFEAVITKHEEGAPNVNLSNDDSTFNLNDYYERSENASKKLQYIGPFGISSDGKIKVEGIKGTIAKQVAKSSEQQEQENGAETNGTYDVILREVSSNRIPNSEEATDGEKAEEIKRPIIKIVYEATCTTDENGNCKFTTNVKEYVWKDSAGNTHKYNVQDKVQVQVADEEPAVDLQENGTVANGTTVELKNSESFGEVLYIHENGKVSLINTEKYPVAINLKKVDSNGNPVEGIKFTGKVIALLNVKDETLIPKEEITDPTTGTLKQKKVEFEFGGEDSNNSKNSGITDYDGVALLEIPEDEIFNYEGEIEVVITGEEWVDSTNKPALGFPNEPFAITGLTLKTDPQTHKSRIEYGDVKVEKCDKNGNKQDGESAYKDKVKKYSTENGSETLGVSVENPILDYDLDLGYKLLKYGDTIEPLKEGVGFKAQVYRNPPKKEDNQKGEYEPEVVIDSQTGKITAKGIKGDITGDDIELVLTETENGHIVKDMEITIVYSYQPDGKEGTKPTIKEYKWKEKQEDGEIVEKSYKPDDDENGNGEEAKNTQIGNMIYTNYQQSVGIINEVIPNPLDIQIEKIDSNGAAVAGIKFEGRIVAVDAQGQERKDESGKTIEKKFTTTITKEDGTEETLDWITTDSAGIARLHLTEEEVNKFAGKIKIEISKEAWSTDEKDPLKVDPEKRTPLDFINGTIEITGKKIKVEEDSTSSIINDGEVKVTIKNGNNDVTEQYKDRVNANAPGEISVSMKNNIYKYNLMNIFDKKVITVNNQEVQITDGIEFTGKIYTDENTKYYYTDENGERKEIPEEELKVSVGFTQKLDEIVNKENNPVLDPNAQIKKGSISAAGINGNIVGDNIKLIIEESKTIDYIIPEKIIVEYSCKYNNGQFETKILQVGIDSNDNNQIDDDEKVSTEDGQDYRVLREKTVKDGTHISIRKVDEQGNTVEGIKFTGYVISEQKNSKDEGVAFEATTNANGIATIELKADYSDKNNIVDEIADKSLLGKFKVVIETEEWADDSAEAKWRAIPGNEYRELKFAKDVTIDGCIMNEKDLGYKIIRYVTFENKDRGNITINGQDMTLQFKNPDLTYSIPIIKTNNLLTEENQSSTRRIQNVSFHITISNGNDTQEYYVTTNEKGMATLDDIHVFGDKVTLTAQETSSEDLTTQMLPEPIIFTYKTNVNYDTGTVTLENVTVEDKNLTSDSEEVKNADYIEIELGGEKYRLIDFVNHEEYKITLDKKIDINGNIRDVNDEIGFKGVVTTNPSALGITIDKETGKIQEINRESFEAALNPASLRDKKDVLAFEGVTSNGKLEIQNVKFYGKQVYVFFVEDKVPESMTKVDEVMWASFSKEIANEEAKSTSGDNVSITGTDPLNITVQVVNQPVNYKIKLRKVDSADSTREINYKNAQFTFMLKELLTKNGSECVESSDKVTLVFNSNGQINQNKSTLPGKYIVGAQLVEEKDSNGVSDKYIELDVNKYSVDGTTLQLVATEDVAPTGYVKYEGDISIKYTAITKAEEGQKLINIIDTVGNNINAKVDENDNLAFEFDLPNAPEPYPIEFYKVSKETGAKLNGIQFQVLFMGANDKGEYERILTDRETLFSTVAGKITIPNIERYGKYYMILKETQTPKETVRLIGYHVIEVNKNIGGAASLTYKGTFAEDFEHNAIDIYDDDATINSVLEKAKGYINNMSSLQATELTKQYTDYFTNTGEGNNSLYFTVKNNTSKTYDINILKKDSSDHNKNLNGAEFDLYLVKANENYANADRNLLKEEDRHKTTENGGKITLEGLGYEEEHYSEGTGYTLENYNAADCCKLVLVETKPPKNYKSTFNRIEITYYTHDGKEVNILKIEVFDKDGNQLTDISKYVEYLDKEDKKESEINIAAYNEHKTEIPLEIKKVYYKEVEEKVDGGNGTKVKLQEIGLPNAIFSGVVIEKETGNKIDFTDTVTDENGIAKIDNIYVEGDIEIVINEVSAPDGFSELSTTTIECKVDGKQITDYSVSNNALESIEWKNAMNEIKLVENDIIPNNISLGGFVWEDKPTDNGKSEDDYTVIVEKEEDGVKKTYNTATEGLFDSGVDELITGITVNLYDYETGEKITSTETGEDGRYIFTELNPFKKYYVTFTLTGEYNYEDYENVKFLVKPVDLENPKVGANGKYEVEQTNSVYDIKQAIDEQTKLAIEQKNLSADKKTAKGIDQIADEYGWSRNSKAVMEEINTQSNNDKNTAITTQTKEFSTEREPVRENVAGVQAYPIFDQFILMDKETSGIDVAEIYEGSGKADTDGVIEDYTLNNTGKENLLIFKAIDPIHNSINFGIVEREEFALKLEKLVDKVTVKINNNDYTYNYSGEQAQGSPYYILPINQADLKNIKGMEIIYKLNVSRTAIAGGTLKSIADYYNSDLMNFEGWRGDWETAWHNDKDKTVTNPNSTANFIPEQYLADDTITKNAANNTGKVLIEVNKEIPKSTETISIYLKYSYKDIYKDNKLFGKIENVNEEYVTLGVAEIVQSYSDIGKSDKKSTNGDLENKYNKIYNQELNQFYCFSGEGENATMADENNYYCKLSHTKDSDVDESAAPALEILIADPLDRKVTGQVFDDENKNGEMDDGEVGIGGIKVELVDSADDRTKGTAITTTEAEAGSDKSKVGTYEFNGVPEGKYNLRFTYGDANTVLPKIYTVEEDDSGNKVISEDNSYNWKLADGTALPRNNDRSYNGLEYESTTQYSIDPNNERWYNDEKRYDEDGNRRIVSDATDNTTRRGIADNTLNTYGGTDSVEGKYIMNNKKAELLYSYRGTVFNNEYIQKLVDNYVSAATPQFKINSMDSDGTNFNYIGEGSYEDENGNIVGTGSNAQINFGVKPRETTNLKLEKEVENVKIYTSSGNSNVDASYEGNRAVGTVGRVQWAKANNGNRGYIWIQRSEEEIIGAKLEITYKIVVRDDNKNDKATVTIVDYVQSGMGFDKSYNDYNKEWNVANATTTTEDDKPKSVIADTAGREIEISDKINLDNVSTVVTRDIDIGDDDYESEPVYITLTKTLNGYSDTDIDAYTNYAEVIQTLTPDLAKKDSNSIPGNFDSQKETTVQGNIGDIGNLYNVITKDVMNREIEEVPYDGKVPEAEGYKDGYKIRLERDTAKALETISITAETGENRDTTYYILAFTAIAILATGVGIIIIKVIKRK